MTKEEFIYTAQMYDLSDLLLPGQHLNEIMEYHGISGEQKAEIVFTRDN